MTEQSLERRHFLKLTGAAGTGLALGFPTVWLSSKPALAASDHFAHAWVAVKTSGKVAIQLPKAEMGQGIYTSLSAIIADEMELPLDQIEVVFASSNPTLYDAKTGTGDITGGSGSIRGGNFDKLRTVGASAREMLRLAAAKKWGTAPTKVDIREGQAIHKVSGKKLGFGELSELASQVDILTSESTKPKRPL